MTVLKLARNCGYKAVMSNKLRNYSNYTGLAIDSLVYLDHV